MQNAPGNKVGFKVFFGSVKEQDQLFLQTLVLRCIVESDIRILCEQDCQKFWEVGCLTVIYLKNLTFNLTLKTITKLL